MMWIMIFIAAVVAYVIGLQRRPKPAKPEPKTFGLEEARAACGFIQTPEQAKAVKAVVVGVLGYEDTVVEEANIAAYGLKEVKGSNIGRIGSYKDDIRALEARIVDVHAANDGIDAETVALVALRSMFA